MGHQEEGALHIVFLLTVALLKVLGLGCANQHRLGRVRSVGREPSMC